MVDFGVVVVCQSCTIRRKVIAEDIFSPNRDRQAAKNIFDLSGYSGVVAGVGKEADLTLAEDLAGTTRFVASDAGTYIMSETLQVYGSLLAMN